MRLSFSKSRRNPRMGSARPVIEAPINNQNIEMQDLQIKQSMQHQKKQELLRESFDAKFVIGVIGSYGSGKEDILQKEILGEDAVLGATTGPSGITISTKKYAIRDQNVLVEFWLTPEQQTSILYSSKYISRLAGLLFFIDVTNRTCLLDIEQWISVLQSSFEHSHALALIANKTDIPGRRAILTEEAEEFAVKNGLMYFETSSSDELYSINAMFQTIVGGIASKVPELHSRELKNFTNYSCPIGLQLGLAIDPILKYQYKRKLQESKREYDGTDVVDWI